MVGFDGTFIDQLLDELDGGKVFQRACAWLFRLSAVGFVLTSLLFFVTATFGSDSWFNGFGDFTIWVKTRYIVSFPIMLAISLLIPITITLILLRRARDIESRQYSGLVAIWLRVIKVAGEVLVVIPVVQSLVVLEAKVFQVRVYNPFFLDWSSLFRPLRAMVGAISQFGQSSYGYGAMTVGQYFRIIGGGAVAVIGTVAVCFGVLVLFYLVAEIGELLYFFLLRRPAFGQQAAQEPPRAR